MKRRMLALAMCAMMLIGLLTACGGKDSGGGEQRRRHSACGRRYQRR